jgi:hypothetical protein
MQRVRIGLTGLACVFLLVIFAAAFSGILRRQARPTDGSASVAANTSEESNAAELPKEPLAELGVAPGNAPPKPIKGNGTTSAN